MLHLTWTKANGEWGVVNVPWRLIPHELSVCLEKLRDYEATELDPETIQNMKDTYEKQKLTIGNTVDGYKIYLLSAVYGLAVNLDNEYLPYMFFEHDNMKIIQKKQYPKMKDCLREFQKRALTI